MFICSTCNYANQWVQRVWMWAVIILFDVKTSSGLIHLLPNLKIIFIMINTYSKTSMTWTPIARLPWLIRTPISQENKYLEIF